MSGPQCGRAPAIRAVNFGPACMILNACLAKHQTEGGGGGIDLSPMDMAMQASRLSCTYICLRFLIYLPDPAKLRTTQHLK